MKHEKAGREKAEGLLMPGGRPSLYCADTVAKIIERMCDGESLRSICRDPEMPHISTVLLWADTYKEFSEQYARAEIVRAQTIFDELFEISDDSSRDTIVDDEGNERTNTEVVARSRLRVDTRKWALSKMMPKKFGDKITQEHTGADGGPVQISSIAIEFVKPGES